tara:strand:+ start:607 stop:999 length:393 start_codon:yes stop_codon:yes gene_type:complete
MDLNINDVKTGVEIIDLITKRGKLEGAELGGVATLRGRLTAAVEQKEGEDAPDLNGNDFANLVELIDVTATRGAFAGSELFGVGSLRNRIVTFLNEMQKQAEAEKAAQAEAPAETGDEPVEAEVVESDED